MLHIAKNILEAQDTSLEDYIDTMTTPGTPIDLVCVLVLARIFHIHIAIFLKKSVWCTSRERSLKKTQTDLSQCWFILWNC